MHDGIARTTAMVLAALFAAAGCGGRQPQAEEPVATRPSGPDPEIFAPLDKARLESRLPVVIGGDEDFPCFQPAGDLAPAEADMVTREVIGKESASVSKAILAWLAGELEGSGVSRMLVGKWSVEVLEPVVLEVPLDRVRFAEGFAENPACLSGRGWLPKGRELAVGLVGATELGFKAQLPLAQDVQNALMQTLGLENMVLESEALFLYEPALGGDGQPMLTPEGQPLFTSPSGEFITQDKVPPPEKRMMSEWVVRSESPLWFAYRAFPADGVRREGDEKKCSVILIPEDLNPQAPDCAEFREAAFTANIIEGESDPVSITVTTGQDQYKGVMMSWNKVAKVQVNDRIILWLKPKQVPVGVELLVNSLVLNPESLAADAAGGDDYAVVGDWKDEGAAVADEPPAKAKGKGKKDPPEKPSKKKGKVSDSDLLEDYLRD